MSRVTKEKDEVGSTPPGDRIENRKGQFLGCECEWLEISGWIWGRERGEGSQGLGSTRMPKSKRAGMPGCGLASTLGQCLR